MPMYNEDGILINEDGFPMITTADARAEVMEEIERLKDAPYQGASTYTDVLPLLDALEHDGTHVFLHDKNINDIRTSIKDEYIRMQARQREHADAIEADRDAAEKSRKNLWVEKIREASTVFGGKPDLRLRHEIEQQNAAVVTAQDGKVVILMRDGTIHIDGDRDSIHTALLEFKTKDGVEQLNIFGDLRNEVMIEAHKLKIAPVPGADKDPMYREAILHVEKERGVECVAQMREDGKHSETEIKVAQRVAEAGMLPKSSEDLRQAGFSEAMIKIIKSPEIEYGIG